VLFNLVFTFVPSDKTLQGFTGYVASVGVFTEEGGVECRHQSATFQAMCQFANLSGKYVRGTLAPYNARHACNLVDVDDNGNFAYFVDTSFGIRGRQNGNPSLQDVLVGHSDFRIARRDLKHFQSDPQVNVIWRRSRWSGPLM